MFIDFVGNLKCNQALEQQVFSCDMPLSLIPLFRPTSANDQVDSLKLMSKQILSLLITLGDSPLIRYYDPTGNGDGISAKLAKILKKDIDDISALDESFPPPSDFRRTILIIVDRSFDMMAPLLHEFTYQAMMNDILSADKPTTDSNPGTNSISFANLDENDPIWLLIRHWHFAESVDYIRNAFTKFLSENKAASQALGSNDKYVGVNGRVPPGLDSLKQMKDTLSSLPQFQAMKSKVLNYLSSFQFI